MRRSGLNRFVSLACAVVLLLLIAANVPFYAGSSIGTTMIWRLEHGRLSIYKQPLKYPEPFSIAINTKPLMWSPDWHSYGPGDWHVRVPIWPAALLCVAWSAWAWWPPRRPRGGCRRCGYSMAGLTAGAACPECGSTVGTRR